MFNEIKDFVAPELDVYARTSEVQLLRYYEPKPGIFIAESPKVIERALNAGYQPISFLVEYKDLEGEAKALLARFPEVPLHRRIRTSGQAYRICPYARNALRNAQKSVAIRRRNLPKCQPHSSA